MMNRLSRWAPLAGVIYVALLAASIFGPSSPDSSASGSKVIAFATNHHDSLLVQAFTLAYAGILLVCFFGVLCTYLRRCGANALAVVSFAGAVLMAAGYFIGAAMNFVLTDHTSSLSASSAQTLNLLNNNLPFVTLFAGMFVMMIFAGIAILSTKALPAWMGWVAVVVGLAGTGGPIAWIGLMLGGLWTVVASIMLFRRVGADGPSTITLPDVPEQAARPQAQPAATTSVSQE
jgi:hypothetical protein